MTKTAIFLADGFEEIEALTVVDLLRRAGIEITTVSIMGMGRKKVTGSHQITVEADALLEDIDFDSLPNQFVLKCTHGCGYNVICKNKLHLDLEDTRQKLNTWMKEDYGRLFFEHHYSFIQPKIICEKFLPSISVSVTDYKIHCINGEPICFFVCTDRDNNHGGHVTYASYSTDWEKLDWLKKEPSEILPKPECLKMMVEYAKILSKPFPYVRVDFYEIERCVIFGEMTFTPYGNILDYYKDAVIVEFGKKLKLPQIYKKEQ